MHESITIIYFKIKGESGKEQATTYMVEDLAWLTLSPLTTFQCLMSFSAAFQPISQFTLKSQKLSKNLQHKAI